MTVLTPERLPERIADVEQLEDVMSTPTQGLVDDLGRLEGDILILGIAGKVGPTLARLAKRAAPGKRIVGVARFSDPAIRQKLESWGIETMAADFLDRRAVERLPKLPNVVFMAGRKFGTTGDEPFTWAMNVHVPGIVADTFTQSRIVAFSTLCVYPFADVARQDCDEATPPGAPGEYANSCLGRERIFQYFSAQHGNPGRLIRLNYAIDLRYGVLHDIASRVYRGDAIELTTGHVNVIWQGDASAQILRALGHCTTPASPLNIGGPETASVRAIAHAFGARFGKSPVFEGSEAETAWVNNTNQAAALFGYPVVPLARMIDWVADWIVRNGEAYDKPTRYEVRDGRF